MIKAKALERNRYRVFFAEDDINAVEHRQNLAGHCGHGGAQHAHGGQTQQAKNQDRIQNQVGHAAHQHELHGIDHVASGLQGLFQGDFDKDAKAAQADHRQILAAQRRHIGTLCEQADEGAGEKQAENGEKQPGEGGQHNAVGSGFIRLLPAFFAQPAGNQGVDAHSRAHRHGDNQLLDGEGQGDGGQRVHADLGNKIAIHNVVKGLNQHRKNGRQRHGDNQPQDWRRPHLVFLGLFHW